MSRNGLRLPESARTLAERFREAGFSTHAVVGSVPVSRRFGFQQGFDLFEDSFDRGRLADKWLPAAQDPEVAGADADNRTYRLGDVVTARALEVLATVAPGDQFLWFHYFDTHDPYGDTVRRVGTMRPRGVFRQLDRGASQEAVVRRANELYREDARYLDRQLAGLLQEIEKDEERYRTHVVITADHGEGLGEDGSFGHGNRVTLGVIQIPCLIRSPELAPGDREEVVGSVDLWRTMLVLAGLAGEGPQGRDLTRPASDGGAVGMRQSGSFTERRLDGSTVEVGPEDLRFFAVASDGTLYRGNRRELLAPLGPTQEMPAELAERLQTRFAGYEESLAAARSAEPADPEALEALRALGYLD